MLSRDKIKEHLDTLGLSPRYAKQMTEEIMDGYKWMPTKYPVPALRGWNNCARGNEGGVRNDYVMVGGMYLDWLRGSLEVY